MIEEWKQVELIRQQLEDILGAPPEVMVVLGSGLKDVDFSLTDCRECTFSSIQGWPSSTVVGHSGILRRGRMGPKELLLQFGRVHLYEGYDPKSVVLPVRAAILWGVKTVILTNAAGSISGCLPPGSIMVIRDHLNLTGVNPLTGPNDNNMGSRFPDMGQAYDKSLIRIALEAGRRSLLNCGEGVYAGLTGPCYETPAEVEMLRRMGADAVGMSTVLEVIAARHMGARVLGLSTISNAAASTCGPPLSHGEVQEIAGGITVSFSQMLMSILEQI